MKLFNKIGQKGLAIFAVVFLSTSMLVNAAEVLKRDTVFAVQKMYGPTTVGIYKVSGNTLTEVNSTVITSSHGAAVGLAVSTKNKLVFISYEGSRTLSVISGETGENFPDLDIPGTNDIAGIVVSESRNRFYAVDRDKPHVYVYNMQSDGNVSRVTSEEFDNLTPDGIWGIDVWGDRLYCTHGKYGPYSGATNKTRISVYDLDTKLEVDGYDTTSATNQAIAVDGSDSSNVMVYTTWANQGTTASVLTQFNLNTRVEKFINLERDGRGISVNPAYGIVYASTGDASDTLSPVARTYGKDQFTASRDNKPIPLGEVDLIQTGEPSDILAVGVTFNPDVTIEITEPGDKNISLCNYATFSITVNNPSPDQTLILDGMEDNYDTNEMRFVSSSVTPDDITDDGNITWSNLNQSIAANGAWTFTKRFLAVSEVNAAHETIRITDAALADGTQVAFENTIYFDIAYSTAVCPEIPVVEPEPEPEPEEVCCTPKLKERDSGSAFGTLSIIMITMLTLLIGSLSIRRNSLKQS